MVLGRSLKACPAGIQQAEIALTSKGWSREELADRVVLEGKQTTQGIGIQTVKKFFSGKQGVDRKYFVAICKALGLEWEVVVGIQQAVLESTQDVQNLRANLDIEATVRDVRNKVKGDIEERCGKMRVLDMTQPIELGDIYTRVNILEKILGRRRKDITELLQDCDLEDFNCFTLGKIQQERVSGLDAVERHSKLMILGKPGAGKTTFLKRLATLCNLGEFQAYRVPVFVTLKDFAEASDQVSLLTYVNQQWSACGVQDTEMVTSLLEHGSALVLLDGLDEVKETEHDRALREIQAFTNQFRACQFVMTCRIAAREYTFEQFTEVEVADFDDDQIAEFATNWFQSKEDPVKAKTFLEKLKDNQPIQELATNPLLLTLLCLVFGEAADFPRNRSELYKEGLDVLLKKWDAKRNIERDQLYKQLSLKRKEDLLSQMALDMFERGEYFFKQRIIEAQVTRYIQNLPDAKTDPESLQLDSEAVLKSIEAQHGLLVERARGIYSFSHLTFQEYFTARQISDSPATEAVLALQNLAGHITEKRWREIFLLTIGMLSNADKLLELMKAQIDTLLAQDEQLQQFLVWVREKSTSVEASDKPAIVRKFYFELAFALTFHLDLIIFFDPILYRIPTLYHDVDIDRDIDIDLNLAITFESARSLVSGARLSVRHRHIDPALARAIDPALKQVLVPLKEQLPEQSSNIQMRQQWWQINGRTWTEELRSVMIENRNIGHEWQFSDKQQKKLRQYYAANQLLIECLNSDCYVTRPVREKIEDTLLLPVTT